MSSRFVLPFADVGSGIKPASGAKLFFFELGTSTPKDTYSDSAATTSNTNPVIADSTGLFPDIWIIDEYSVTLKDKNDVQIWSNAEISGSSGSLVSVARALNVGVEDVIFSTDTTTPIPAYIYASSQQKTYSVPSDAQGELIVSVIADQLTTDNVIDSPYTLINVLISDLSQDYIFGTVADLKSSLIKFPDGKTIRTISYYDGWAATEEGPVGGSDYTKVTKAEHDIIRDTSTVDETGDHTLQDGNVALLVKPDRVCITQYGAWQYASAAVNNVAIQSCWSNNKASKMPDGVFNFDAQLIYGSGYGWSFTGTGFTSELRWNGLDATWAIDNPNTAFNIEMKNFTISGPVGTITKKLLNTTETRYSEFINVVLINAQICFKHNANWLNKFTSCVFACSDSGLYDGVSDTTAILLADDGLPTDVSNATNFDSCRIEASKHGVLCNGGGRNITFTNGTVFEQNKYHIKIVGEQNIRTFLVDGCYMEAASGAPLWVDAGNITAGSIDGVQITNTMVTCGIGSVAALLYISGVAAQDISIALINNTIEFATQAQTPTTGMIIYTPDGTDNIRLTYETVFSPRLGAAVVFTPIHYDKDLIQLRRFTTNVPFKLDVLNGSDGNPFLHEGTQRMLMECRNGTARIWGTAVNAANTTLNPAVCAIPVSAGPTTPFYNKHYNLSSGSQTTVVGSNVLTLNNLLGGTAYVDISYLMSRGVQVLAN